MKNISKDLTIIIVTFHSDHYLNLILKKLKTFKVVVVENSNDKILKKKIEKKYKNVNFILSGSNIGFGSALNIAINNFQSKYYLIINPDCQFKLKTIFTLYDAINQNRNISVLTSKTLDKKNRLSDRHGYFISTFSKKNYFENLILKQVDFIIGHFFIIKGDIFKKVGFFDENIFLNYEEIDLFKRLQKQNYKIFIHKKTEIKHLDGQSCFTKKNKLRSLIEVTKCSKWHLAWSKYYYYKKNYNFTLAIIIIKFFLLKSISQLIYFFLIGDLQKRDLALSFIKGSLASLLNKKSFYRPKI